MPHPDDLTDEEADLLNIVRDDPEVLAEETRQREIEANFRREFLISMMQNKTFRAWLMGQLVGFGTFENSFGASPTGFPDHAATQFQLGMKAAGWHLWTLFDDVAPDLASQMRREATATGPNSPTAAQQRAPIPDNDEPEIVP